MRVCVCSQVFVHIACFCTKQTAVFWISVCTWSSHMCQTRRKCSKSDAGRQKHFEKVQFLRSRHQKTASCSTGALQNKKITFTKNMHFFSKPFSSWCQKMVLQQKKTRKSRRTYVLLSELTSLLQETT